MSKRQTIGFMIFAFLYGGIGGYIGISIFPGEIISANHIFLEDQDGNRRIALTGKDQNPLIGIVNRAGDAQIALGTTNDGESVIGLSKNSEKMLIAFQASEQNNVHGLAVYGRNYEVIMELFLGPDGVYGLNMLDEKDRTRSFYGVDDTGEFKLVFFDEKGNEIWKVPNE